jgi:hypothetical protein
MLAKPDRDLRGPRPSQRPSRASWQLTNFEHFLSQFEALRPRPWAFASVDIAKIINRLIATIPNKFVEVERFISSSLKNSPANEGSGPQWATIASRFMPLLQRFTD